MTLLADLKATRKRLAAQGTPITPDELCERVRANILEDERRHGAQDAVAECAPARRRESGEGH